METEFETDTKSEIILSSPYHVHIKNNSNEVKRAVLFGYAKYFNKKNFGSDDEIDISASYSNVEYNEILIESAFNPFTIGLTKIYCKGGVESLLDMQSEIVCTSPDGCGLYIPFLINEYINDELKDCETHIEITRQIHVNKDTRIYLDIPPKSDFTMAMYPCDKNSKKVEFNKPLPYIFKFDNITDDLKKCKIFGYNNYIIHPNFGSETGIEVSSSNKSVNYMQMLSQSASCPFDCDKIKVQCYTNSSQIENIISYKSKNPLGEPTLIQINPIDYRKETTKNNIEMLVDLRIDGNSDLEFDIFPKTKGYIYIYQKLKK